jgi:hypothetical protein
MGHAWDHSRSSAKRFGGKPEDYLELHSWLDNSKSTYANFRHRALRHHTLGIFDGEQLFGVTITNSAGKQIPVRVILEQHVREDCNGHIPTPQEWLEGIPQQPWMNPHPAYQRELQKMIQEENPSEPTPV